MEAMSNHDVVSKCPFQGLLSSFKKMVYNYSHVEGWRVERVVVCHSKKSHALDKLHSGVSYSALCREFSVSAFT